jgi:hypothetical protein
VYRNIQRNIAYLKWRQSTCPSAHHEGTQETERINTIHSQLRTRRCSGHLRVPEGRADKVAGHRWKKDILLPKPAIERRFIVHPLPRLVSIPSKLPLWYPRSRIRTRPKPSDFSGEKIHSMLSLGEEVKPSDSCRRFVACKRTLRFTWKLESAGKIDRLFLAQFRHSLTEVSHVAWHGAPLEMTDGTKGGAQRASSLRPRCFGELDSETATHIYLSCPCCTLIYKSFKSQAVYHLFPQANGWRPLK